MTTSESELCHCGQPLHYTDPQVERLVRKLIALEGPTVTVTSPAGSWRVPRHYIALHGLRSQDLPRLGFEEVPR